MPSSYAIVGTGAVGGFYGARLVRAGYDVSFLARRDASHLQQHGLRVTSPDGDIVLPTVRAFADVAMMPRAQVVIVAVKATANDALVDILPHLVMPGGLVLLVQNGLGGEDAIAAAAAPARVLGGLAFVCATRIGPGVIMHVTDALIEVAPWTADGAPATPDAAVEQLAAELRHADIPVRLFDNLALARWRKLIWNIPFSGLSVALDTDTRVLVDDPDALAIVHALIAEVAAAAAACGHDIDVAFQRKMVDATRAAPPYRPSLKVDFDAGAALELDAIFGQPLRVAARAGFDARLLGNLLNQLRVLDRLRPRKRNQPASRRDYGT